MADPPKDGELKDGLEYDENGVPYYRWPPFPKPKEGVTIIPFEDFKPSGIQINMDPDAVELDGLGIPTVKLKVKHDNNALPKKKKKTKVHLGGTLVKKSTWYEDWAEGEDLRSNHSYNQMMAREDRLLQASEDFRTGRRWPPLSTEVSALYDHFRVFIGLIGNPMRGIYKKNPEEELEDDGDDEEEGELADEGVLPPMPRESEVMLENKPKKRRPREEPQVERDYDLREDAPLEAKEVRLEAFLNDPELAMNIFFSSYFRDKGLLWERKRLIDSPILASFYLNFLIRNRALPESKKELIKALEIVEQAKKQLPLTRNISLSLPDELGKACVGLFGPKVKLIVWPENMFPTNGEEDLGQPRSKRVRVDGNAEMTAESNIDVDESANSMDVDKPSAVEVEETIMDVDADNSIAVAENTVVASGWGSSTNSEVETSTWGLNPQLIIDNGNLGSGTEEQINWPDGNGDHNPWAVTETPWPELPKPSLMKFIGPSLFPLFNTTGYVERSTRRIVSWAIPAPISEDQPTFPGEDLRALFVAIVLAPWVTYDSNERAAVKAPEIIHEPEKDADSGKIKEHKPTEDNITLLVDPKLAEHLCAGMGIGGTFIQVIRKFNPDAKPINIDTESGSNRKNLANSRRGGNSNRGRGKNSARREPADQPWWYLEQLEQVLVSFWTERSA